MKTQQEWDEAYPTGVVVTAAGEADPEDWEVPTFGCPRPKVVGETEAGTLVSFSDYDGDRGVQVICPPGEPGTYGSMKVYEDPRGGRYYLAQPSEEKLLEALTASRALPEWQQEFDQETREDLIAEANEELT